MEVWNMMSKNLFSVISLALFVFIGNTALAACPSADLTGDCFVDYEDLADMGGQWLNGYDCNDLTEMASQWLTTDPNAPDDPSMVYTPGGEFEMGRHVSDPCYSEPSSELPVHAVFLDSFFIGKYEITNQQYCDYLNSAYPGQIKVVSGVVYASSDNPCDYPYCDTHSADGDSQIDFSDPDFSVRSKDGRDMSDDPMVMVSWYGSVAYCNWRSVQEDKEKCYNLSTWECYFSKHGYRLPTEAEWEYAARGGEHSPYYRFPWGDTISHSQANYCAIGGYPYDLSDPNGYHPDYNDVMPYTAPVGSFSANGYGLYDMAGNVWEWCNDWYDPDYYDTSPYDNPTGPASGSGRVLRGGGWSSTAHGCRVADRNFSSPGGRGRYYGVRIVLDLTD